MSKSTNAARGSMTVAEAGRKGGEKVRTERGREFFEHIGRKGGTAVAEERGSEFYQTIGGMGGIAVAAKYGIAHYTKIGKMGGTAARDKMLATDPNHFKKIGLRGGAKIRRVFAEHKELIAALTQARNILAAFADNPRYNHPTLRDTVVGYTKLLGRAES